MLSFASSESSDNDLSTLVVPPLAVPLALALALALARYPSLTECVASTRSYLPLNDETPTTSDGLEALFEPSRERSVSVPFVPAHSASRMPQFDMPAADAAASASVLVFAFVFAYVEELEDVALVVGYRRCLSQARIASTSSGDDRLTAPVITAPLALPPLPLLLLPPPPPPPPLSPAPPSLMGALTLICPRVYDTAGLFAHVSIDGL